MKIKNYCIAVIDNVNGVKDEIASISDSAVRYVDGKGLIIATFSSFENASALKDFFTRQNRSFLLFELGDNNYAAHFGKENIYNHLFGELDNIGHNLYTIRQQLINDVLKNRKDTKASVTATTATTETIVEPKQKVKQTQLTEDEIKNKINELLDKGFENLTPDEKKTLSKLGKKVRK